MQRFGPPPSYPHLKIPGLNTSFSDPQYNYYLQRDKDDEEVGKIITNIYGGMEVSKEDEVVDKAVWGELGEAEDEDNYDYYDTGIENEVTKKTQNFDLSHVSGGTTFTSGLQ